MDNCLPHLIQRDDLRCGLHRSQMVHIRIESQMPVPLTDSKNVSLIIFLLPFPYHLHTLTSAPSELSAPKFLPQVLLRGTPNEKTLSKYFALIIF
jgi:hypothetical protein